MATKKEELKEEEVEKINLLRKNRVDVELLIDLPSMRKKAGETIKTHPLNVKYLVDKKVAKKL